MSTKDVNISTLNEIFNPDSPVTKLEHNLANLKALLETQYLQRVFWIELTHKLEDFELRVLPMGYNYYEVLFIEDELIAPEDEWYGGEDTYSPCMIDVDWEIDKDPPWVTVSREEHENEGRWREVDENTVEPWYADASPNLDFRETLKWDILPNEKKMELFEFLKFGLNQEDLWLKEASEHFLACMARHPDTPSEVIQGLNKLNSKLIERCIP